jgi:hypothetical protein
MGLPTPPTFILTVDSAIDYYMHEGKELSSYIVSEYRDAVKEIEKSSNKKFGSTEGPKPLILCVRAGAPLAFTSTVGMNDLPEFLDDHKHDPFGFRGAPER